MDWFSNPATQMVDTLSKSHQGSAVIHLCIFWAVLVFVKTAVGPVGAAERTVLRTVRGTLAVKGAFAVVAALQGYLTFMCKRAVEFDLLADSRFIFANGLCNSCFCRTIDDPGKDDASFYESQMGKSIRIISIIHMLPAFPAAVRQIKCKTKCSI